jgi:hypothetical protein
MLIHLPELQTRCQAQSVLDSEIPVRNFKLNNKNDIMVGMETMGALGMGNRITPSPGKMNLNSVTL